MSKVEEVAESQAKYDGRSLVGMPKFERNRYMERARAAIEAADRDWRPMGTAPTDGTIIEVAGRYPSATAGFPRYVGYHDGKWWQHSRNAPEEIIPWAWRPRTDWPDEPNSAFALNEEG